MKECRSYLLLGSDVHGAKIEKVGVRVVAVDFKYFGDEPPARPTFNVDDDVERIGDIGLDRTVRKLNATLQNATSKSSQALLRGTRVDRAQCTGMARIQELKQVEGLASSNFSQQNTLGPVP